MGSDFLPETEPMCGALRNVEVYDGDGAYDHGANTRVYDIHGAARGVIVLEADWGRRRFGLDRAYYVHGHGHDENN